MSQNLRVNPDLEEERRRVTFDVGSISNFIYGAEKLKAKREAGARIQAQLGKELYAKNVDFMSRQERIEHSMQLAVDQIRQLKENGEETDVNAIQQLVLSDTGIVGHHVSSLNFHLAVFVPFLLGQCTEEQLADWLPKALSFQIIGTYAQTELAHVGVTSNCAIVSAQLYTKGKCYGAHYFMVQLRDFKTHEPLPGIVVGEIGPKFPMAWNDNGFLQLNQVRIPRTQMFMRFSQVLPDGTYVPAIHEKLNYGSMVFLRSMLVQGFSLMLARACTIAIRYSCVRRQGEIEPGAQEVKVIDYTLQQYKLFPYLASSYAFYFAGEYIKRTYNDFSADAKANVVILPELHALSSGLKAFCSWESARGTQIMLLACGGHGHSLASNMPQLYEDLIGICTAEGENTVLLLQVARFLLKMMKEPAAMRMSKTCQYLLREQSDESKAHRKAALDVTDLLDAYQHLSRKLVSKVSTQMNQLVRAGRTPGEATNECALLLIRAAKAHIHQFILKSFADAVASARTSVPQTDVTVLEQLLMLYALFGIYKRPGKYLENGVISLQQLDSCKSALYGTLAKIRPNAIGLAEAFEFSDQDLHSELGRYDGRVYEHLFEWAKQSPLNRKDVLDSHRRYWIPMINRSKI